MEELSNYPVACDDALVQFPFLTFAKEIIYICDSYMIPPAGIEVQNNKFDERFYHRKKTSFW